MAVYYYLCIWQDKMLVLLIIATSLLAFVLIRRQARKAVEPPRLPGALPVIGHTHLVIKGDTEVLWDNLMLVTNESLSVGGIGTTNFGPQTIYILTDPEATQDVLSQCLEKDLVYNFWETWVGQGLLTGKVETWKRSRKILLPSFNQRALDEFIPIFNQEARKIVNKLSSKVDGEPFDTYNDFARMGLQTVFKTVIGQDGDKDEAFIDEYLQRIHAMMDFSINRVSKAWYHIEAIYKLTGKKDEERKVMKMIHDISLEAIEKRKAVLMNNNSKPKSTRTGLQPKLFIDLLIENNLKGNISEQQIIDEINTIIFGGYDTSAASLMYTFLLLGSHPEKQNKVVQEIDSVVGDAENVQKEHISKLVYTEAAIKEAMRLYPFMSFLGRYVDKNIKIKNYTLYKGSRCLMLIYGMHRNPVWGPDAEQFRPERWLDPSSLPDCPAAFAGFSFGKRGCIGKTYAMISMKTTMVHVLRKYRFVSDVSKLQLRFHVVLKPKSGHLVTIHRRCENSANSTRLLI